MSDEGKDRDKVLKAHLASHFGGDVVEGVVTGRNLLPLRKEDDSIGLRSHQELSADALTTLWTCELQ